MVGHAVGGFLRRVSGLCAWLGGSGGVLGALWVGSWGVLLGCVRGGSGGDLGALWAGSWGAVLGCVHGWAGLTRIWARCGQILRVFCAMYMVK